jgi:hypothetical protein
VTRGTDRSAKEPRLEERRLRRLKHGQLYSAGRVTRLGMEAPVRRSLGPPSAGISKDGSYGRKPPAAGWTSPLPRRWLPIPHGSAEFGSSSASRCDKRTAGKRPGRRSLADLRLVRVVAWCLPGPAATGSPRRGTPWCRAPRNRTATQTTGARRACAPRLRQRSGPTAATGRYDVIR